jgi:hypothetical protein
MLLILNNPLGVNHANHSNDVIFESATGQQAYRVDFTKNEPPAQSN